MENLLSEVGSMAQSFNGQFEMFEAFAGTVKKEEAIERVNYLAESIIRTIKDYEEDVPRGSDANDAARRKFQQDTNGLVAKSYLINRTRTWPQGYQGDFKTLEAIYRNTPLSRGVGYFLDHYSMNHPLAVAVRNRINILSDMLRNELSSRKSPAVLNIACGSCRELMAVTDEIYDSGARINCIDYDSDALQYALGKIQYSKAMPHVTFRKYNAIRLFDYDSILEDFGRQDVIYSVGYFDYIDDDLLVRTISSLYRLLKEGGKLILAFKDADYYDATPFRWILDWDGFMQRNADDFNRILADAGMPVDKMKITKDETNIITFFTINK